MTSPACALLIACCKSPPAGTLIVAAFTDDADTAIAQIAPLTRAGTPIRIRTAPRKKSFDWRLSCAGERQVDCHDFAAASVIVMAEIRSEICPAGDGTSAVQKCQVS